MSLGGDIQTTELALLARGFFSRQTCAVWDGVHSTLCRLLVLGSEPLEEKDSVAGRRPPGNRKEISAFQIGAGRVGRVCRDACRHLSVVTLENCQGGKVQ